MEMLTFVWKSMICYPDLSLTVLYHSSTLVSRSGSFHIFAISSFRSDIQRYDPITMRFLGATAMSQRSSQVWRVCSWSVGCGRQFKVGEAPLFIRDNGVPHNGTSLLHYQRNSLFQEQADSLLEHDVHLLELNSCKGRLKIPWEGGHSKLWGYIWEFAGLYAWFTHSIAYSALLQLHARGLKTSL